MKSVLLCTNIPAPYSVDFYNELGKYYKLTVLYERHTSSERDAAWVGNKAIHFEEVYLKLTTFGVEQARGSALRRYIKHHKSDVLIFANYASPASLEAIIWCRLHKRKYIVCWDGGFYKEEPFFKKCFKRLVLCGAEKHLISCDDLNKYLLSLGISHDRIFKYPFTSVREKDIVDINRLTLGGKEEQKSKLGIEEKRIVLSVGRFSYEGGYGKGYDVLLKAASNCFPSIGFYIVGDEPTAEFVQMKAEMNLDNVHFIGFKTKEELSKYYLAADLFVLLSRGDVWGLVINEAMSYGLPIITSDKCIAGKELVKDGENGFIVSLNEEKIISQIIDNVLGDDKLCLSMGKESLQAIRYYTIEAMTLRFKEILDL